MDKTKPIAALFDFDGVVMDTEPQYTIYWDEIGKKYHPETENFGLIIKGQTLAQIYDRYFRGMDDVQAEITAGLNIFEREMKYEYVAGVTEFMKQLRDNGVKTAIVTSSNEKKMANVYSAHPELKGLVDRILTAEMFTRSKPAPDCFLLGAKVFDTLPENCIVFEDSFHGLQAGTSAQMKVVGLSTTNPEEAIKDKCDIVIPNFSNFTYKDVISLLDK